MLNKLWEVRNQTATSAELLLYGVIYSEKIFDDEISAAEVDRQLKELGSGITDLTVRINSPGGSVFAGQAIHSMLARHNANVTVYVDGLAGSIASVVAMAGDTIIMPRNSMLMIHNPTTIAMGNAADFRKEAEILDQVRETLIEAYTPRFTGTRAELIAALDAETFYTAAQAVAAGFADQIEERADIAACYTDDGGRLFAGGIGHDIAAFTTKAPGAQARPTPLTFRERAASVTESVDDLVNRIEARLNNRHAEGRPVNEEDRQVLIDLQAIATRGLASLDAEATAASLYAEALAITEVKLP